MYLEVKHLALACFYRQGRKLAFREMNTLKFQTPSNVSV